jgi:hypothetical protein
VTWAPLTIAAPALNAAALNAELALIAVDPWTHGVASGIGGRTALSFPNAAKAVAERLTGIAGAGFALAVAAVSHSDLAAQCAALAGAFPLPDLARLARRAQAMAELETSKYTLVPPQSAPRRVAVNALPAVRALQRADRIKAAFDAAGDFKASDPLDNLTAFAAEAAAQADLAAAVQDEAKAGLAGGAGWRFHADDNLASRIVTGHPGHDKTLTAIFLFVGPADDLQIFREIFP